METIHVLGYFGALAVGLVLGLMGGGGSIMAFPIFAYLFQISPMMTATYSLFVVGTSASVGALKSFKKGLIEFRIAFVFAIPVFAAVYITRRFLIHHIPEQLISIRGFELTRDMGIMLLFAVLMIIASISMIWEKKEPIHDETIVRFNYPLMIGGGFLIGILTGVVGIGGGFLIIPVLVLIVKLPMKKAVATSLSIIALKSFIGFSGDFTNLEINWPFLTIFTLISISGMFLGIYLSSFVKGDNLKKSFGWFVLIMAIVIFCKEAFT